MPGILSLSLTSYILTVGLWGCVGRHVSSVLISYVDRRVTVDP